MQEERDLTPAAHLAQDGDARWQINVADFVKAIRSSNNSSPGPDGIPFGAWRSLDRFAAAILWGAYEELSAAGNDDILSYCYPEFNESLMVFLPKQAVAQDDLGVDVYDPDGTRPLNIANADNRLMANAVRLRIEQALDEVISGMQRGFVGGRSLIANIVDIDEAMNATAATQSRGAALFYDFAAAFPSVSQEFLIE